MSGTHGDLSQEIGALVFDAHSGNAIDLSARAEDLAQRYVELGVPADAIVRAITRSLGAVGLSLARMPARDQEAIAPAPPTPRKRGKRARKTAEAEPAAALFPSGVRLAVLS